MNSVGIGAPVQTAAPKRLLRYAIVPMQDTLGMGGDKPNADTSVVLVDHIRWP